MNVTFTLNGKSVTVNTEPDQRLVQILREELQLTGTKSGCYRGECGSCSVLLAGEMVPSCLVPAFAVRGAEVVTIEGFTRTREYGEIVHAFEEAEHTPCGHCFAGRVLAIHALLVRLPSPSEREILAGLSGIRCQCADVSSLLRAVNLVAYSRTRKPHVRGGGHP